MSAYAPEEAPEIVVVALFENGEHGDRASWIVRDVMKAYFDKKERKAKGLELQTEMQDRLTATTLIADPLRGGETEAIMGYRAFKELDWPLIIVTLILSGLGIIQVYSATNGTKWEGAWQKQIIWVITGLIMMWGIAVIGYQSLMAKVLYLYGGVIGLLFATTLIGNKVFGSTRWIRLGGFTLQPSEFVKIVLILAIARYLIEFVRPGTTLSWGDLGKLGLLVGFPHGSRHETA